MTFESRFVLHVLFLGVGKSAMLFGKLHELVGGNLPLAM